MPRQNPKNTSRSSKSSSKPTTTPSSNNESQLPESIRSDPSLIHLDGRTLEGGGQLVRVALTLSALTSIPIHINHIRGNRSGSHSQSSGRQRGGLKSSHLAAVEFLAHATAAKTWGARVGSTEAVFEPGRNRHVLRDRAEGPAGIEETTHEIRLDKPGSVWLILQAILPYLLFAATSTPAPIQLLLTGGTNVPKSMSGEYVKQVMCPIFEKLGLPPINVDIRTRGWTHGRSIQLGEVCITIHPLSQGTYLPAFHLTDRGPVTRIAISVLAGAESTRNALIQHTTQILQQNFPHLPSPSIEVAFNEDSSDPKRIYLLLVAHTSHGYRLGRDWLFDEKLKSVPHTDSEFEQLLAERMARRVVGELGMEIEHGGCVDEYMRDQIVVFEALARGRSVVDAGNGTGEGSLHARTCRWVREMILSGEVKFEGGKGGGYHGLGFIAGEVYGERKGGEDEIEQGSGEERERIGSELVEDGDEAADDELARKLEDLEVSER